MNALPFNTRLRRSVAMRARRSPDPGTNTAGIVLAIALIVSVAGSVVTYLSVRSAFAEHTLVDAAQAQLDTLYRTQLEEDSRLHGYLASGQRLYLAPYSTTEPDFDRTLSALQEASDRAGLGAGDALIFDIKRAHSVWVTEVEQPLVAQPNSASFELQKNDKFLTDRMRRDFKGLGDLYADQSRAASDRIEGLLRRAAISTAALILVFGFAAIVADLFRSRTQMALQRERVVTDTLQRAFISGWDSVPHLHVGTAYVSSTREAAVGGDLFDIHRVDEHRTLLLVADVSGKGLNAAVETAQVKYSIRTLIEDYADPATVLAKFNRSFIRSQRDLSSFVSAFVGILDDRDWTMRYASGGHSPAYVRRPDWVEQLPVTGPVLGVTDEVTFSSLNVSLAPGDTLVLATDGLTEARDSAGVLVDDDGVIRWIRDGEADPEHLATELVAKVTRFAGGRINDDLALLVLRIEAPRPLTGQAGAPDGARIADARPSSLGE